MSTTRLKLPQMTFSQAQKHVTYNEALQMLDVFTAGTLLSITEHEPPTSPNEGDAYYVSSSPTQPTGDWTAYPEKIAHFFNGMWYFYDVPLRIMMYIEDDAEFVRWTGSEWQSLFVFGGKTFIDVTGGNVTLTSEEARAYVLQIGGTNGASEVSITLPQLEQSWQVLNDSNAAVRLRTGSGGEVFLEAGKNTIASGDGVGIRAGMNVAPEGLSVGNLFRPPIYETANAPDPTPLYGHIAMITDGDGGEPCLSVSDGFAWRVIQRLDPIATNMQPYSARDQDILDRLDELETKVTTLESQAVDFETRISALEAP